MTCYLNLRLHRIVELSVPKMWKSGLQNNWKSFCAGCYLNCVGSCIVCVDLLSVTTVSSVSVVYSACAFIANINYLAGFMAEL